MSTYSCTLVYSLSSLSGGEERLQGSLSSWEGGGDGEGNEGGKEEQWKGITERMKTGEEEEGWKVEIKLKKCREKCKTGESEEEKNMGQGGERVC